MTVVYGVVGSKGSVSTKQFASEEKALKEAQKKLKEKAKKGYSQVEGKDSIQEDTKKRSTEEVKVDSKKKAKTVADTSATGEVQPPFSEYMEVELRGGMKRWWSIHQEGLGVTTCEGNGDPPTGEELENLRKFIRERQTKEYKTQAKAVAEAQKLHKRKLKVGYKSVDGKEAIRPEAIPETYAAFLTAETKSGGKYWAVERIKDTLTIHYGAIGSDGTIVDKEYQSNEKAHTEAIKMATHKKGEGYTLIEIKSKPPNLVVGDATEIEIATLNDAMALPIRITGHWRRVDDHTADYVVKFVLERKQGDSTDWSFALLHQECCVHDGQFARSSPQDQDLPVVASYDDGQAKAVFQALVDIMNEQEDRPVKIQGQFKPPEGLGHHEVWQNVEMSVECQGQTLLSLFLKSVKPETHSINQLKEKTQAFVDGFQTLVGLTQNSLSVFDANYKGKGVDQEERWDMKSMPLYL